MSTPLTPAPLQESFLPDFCSKRVVLSVIVAGELLAIILTLSLIQTNSLAFWETLSRLSLFIQWLGLSGCTILCIIRHRLRIKDSLIIVISYLILLCNTLLFTELTYLALNSSDLLALVFTQVDHQQFLIRTLLIAAIIYALFLGYLYMHQQQQRQVKIEADIRYQLLQARIRPHFLFNTMNSIACLVHDDPDNAERAIENLSDLLRATLKEQSNCLSLQQELTLCRHYLEIEKLRLGERLQVKWQMDEAETWVPPLLIQPLVENAVYHGIEPSADGGCIEITSRQQDDKITISISNPQTERPSAHQGHQLALKNIQQRLQLAYGDQASMSQQVNAGCYQITLQLPIIQESPCKS